jgi:hypothetical protein
MEFEQALSYLAGAGAFVVTSYVASWGLEEFGFWHALHTKVRSLIVLALSIGLGLGATALLRDPDLVAAISPWAVPVLLIGGAWIVTQKAHQSSPTRR